MHTLLDLRGNIPTFIRITAGKTHDVNILDEFLPEPGAFYVMDRAYVDFERLFVFTLCSSFFVVRTKKNILLQRRYSHPVDKSTGLRSDQTVILTAIESAKAYPDSLRRVSYFDAATNKRLKFLTNNFALFPRPQHIACGAVEDYPRTLEEFEGRFATEQACREYLMQLRWPQGFVCPRCGGRRARPSRRGLLRCGQCDYQASVTAGTIFQDTRLPLRTWFRTMWWVTSQKNGASALGLQSILGLGSYRTAWALLHKLRRAMVRPGRERLSGRVEVDETYVGGAEEGLRGRQTQKKALVAIAAEEDGAGIGRIRMKRIRGAYKQQLHGFIQEAVEPDSTIHTDGWEGYVGLEALGYRHEYDFLAGSSQSASELLPHVHRVAALLKRWLIGTHQGAVSREHLDYYLDEYTFRFNRRRSRHRGKLFYRLVQQAATVGPTTYSEMVQHLRGRRTGQPQDVG